LECPLYCWSDGEVDRQLDPAAEVQELHRIARRFLGAAS